MFGILLDLSQPVISNLEMSGVIASDDSPSKNNDVSDENVYKDVIPPGYTLEHLRKVMQDTNIKDQCTFLADTTDVGEICDKFLALMRTDKTLEDIASLYGAASILYMITNTTQTTLVKRTTLLERVFQEADTLTPYHINYFVEQLLLHLKDTNEPGYMLNILKLLPRMSVASETGKAIAVSLARFIIAEIVGKKIILHSFKSFKELISMLNSLNLEEFVQSAPLTTIYVLVHALGFLLNAVAFGQNEAFINTGYRNLKPTAGESKKLQTFCEKLRHCLEDQLKKNLESPNSELRMQITRYIMLTILNLLDTDENTFNTITIS